MANVKKVRRDGDAATGFCRFPVSDLSKAERRQDESRILPAETSTATLFKDDV
jgi:hypothetical protein